MKKLMFGVLLGVVALPLVAQDKQFSGEILLGKTSQDLQGDFIDTDGDDTLLGLRGAFNLDKNIGFELSYLDHGETSDTFVDGFGDTVNVKMASDALGLGLKGVLPLEQGFSLLGRLGLAFWEMDFKGTDSSMPGQVFVGDDSGNDLYFGVGAQYSINSQLFIGLEYTMAEYGVSPDKDFRGLSGDVDVRTIALSLGFKF